MAPSWYIQRHRAESSVLCTKYEGAQKLSTRTVIPYVRRNGIYASDGRETSGSKHPVAGIVDTTIERQGGGIKRRKETNSKERLHFLRMLIPVPTKSEFPFKTFGPYSHRLETHAPWVTLFCFAFRTPYVFSLYAVHTAFLARCDGREGEWAFSTPRRDVLPPMHYICRREGCRY